ncbi:uncharacterized protein LOC143955619 isoform X4 [Lithobates pipiens]
MTMRMDKEQSQMAEKIINLTLEIIYLLTGESFPPVKSGAQLTITVPPLHSLNPERNNNKILEVTKKMMELLTGEVPIRCQDVTVYFSMEEWEYLEGHKDLYKDVMMDNQPPLTSPDGSSNGNPPERCPRPLYSRDSTQEGHTIPHHHQSEDLIPIKEEEETYVMGDQQPTKDFEMTMNNKLEQFFLDIDTDGLNFRNTSEKHLLLSQDFVEDNGIPPYSPEVNAITHNIIHQGPYQLEWSMNPSNPEETSDKSHTIKPEKNLSSRSIDTSTDPSNFKESSLGLEEAYTGENSLCSRCGKSFTNLSELLLHLKSHSSVTYTCSECWKSFPEKSELLKHQKSHMGDNLYPCSQCGKCFTQKGDLNRHQRVHTGERPFPCPDCGKYFAQKANLVTHKRIHTGERPYSCSECGKCFRDRGKLIVHEKIHTGERPYSCSVCGKCFIRKGGLLVHQRSHTGERPYSCSECGKCFTEKGKLIRHQSSHTGERPFSCPECGKCFSLKENLNKHQKTHVR